MFDTLKSRVQKFTKGFNLFKPEIKAGKTVTFNTWIEENKIPKEIAFKFERVHRTRIANLVKQDESSVDAIPEYNDPKEILRTWIMFNMQKAGKFVKKNSKKIAAVAAVTGAAVAGTQSVKRKRKTSPKRKKKEYVKKEKNLLQREKLHQKRKNSSPKRRKLHRGEERRQRVKLRSY